jgi:hypothetical protein
MARLNENKGESNMEAMLEKAARDLAKLEPSSVCMKGGVIFNREQDSYILPYLNRRYLVHHNSGKVKALSGQSEVSIQLCILFLHYLACADGTPHSGKWITIKDLPGGQKYAETEGERNIHPSLQSFSSIKTPFHDIAVSLGASLASVGNYSLLFHPFPKVPLIFVSWVGDEKFSFAKNILYDTTALNYLPIGDCALLPELIMQEMIP